MFKYFMGDTFNIIPPPYSDFRYGPSIAEERTQTANIERGEKVLAVQAVYSRLCTARINM